MNALYFPEFEASIRWYDSGTGEPILFLAGLSMPVAPGFLAIAAHPALARRRCILLDYLGAGQSDHPIGFDFALESHAAVIARVLEHLGFAHVDLVGHSMGGAVGVALASLRPDLVSRLVLGEANLDPGGGLMSLRVSQNGEEAFLRGGYSALLDDLRIEARNGASGADRLVAGLQVADPKGIFANAQALVDLPEDSFERFAALPVPKTFIFGANSLSGESTPDTPDLQRFAKAGIPTSIIPDAGHAMMVDNPAGFVEALVHALDLA